ncbi:MAG: MetQ/NlpA family ABC transporter substrate-binding protein [Anaerolineae bacterium]|jgi:NitT/TauT family transport system substrate-binding protein
MHKKRLWSLFIVLLLFALMVAGCGGGDPTPSLEAAPTPEPEETVQGLKMALLPVMDVLPFHVAEQNGYFEQVGVEVELVPVKSAQERDTLMQTGQVDGMLTDLLSPVFFNQDEPQIVVVRTARRVYPESPLFSIVAKPGSDVQSPADLAGVEIGISQNTVIEYLTDRMLENAGLTPEQIAVTEVSAIPVRFELLMNGEIPAATLPDPLTSGAIAAGAVLVVDDTSVPELSQSILAFRTGIVEDQPDAVRRFLEAWEMAVGELNAKPDDYRDLLIEKGRVPESIQGTFQMPPFPEASVPTEEQLADVVEWALDKGLVSNDVPYERMVNDSYLP